MAVKFKTKFYTQKKMFCVAFFEKLSSNIFVFLFFSSVKPRNVFQCDNTTRGIFLPPRRRILRTPTETDKMRLLVQLRHAFVRLQQAEFDYGARLLKFGDASARSNLQSFAWADQFIIHKLFVPENFVLGG